ncbi:MAG: aminoglycoside phosphotransferase family protein [Thermomicrobiales bacterium]
MNKELHLSIEETFGQRLISQRRMSGGSVNQVYGITLERSGECVLRQAPSSSTIGAFPSWLTPWGLRREQSAIALLDGFRHLLPQTLAFHESDDPESGDWVVQTLVSGQSAASAMPAMGLDESSHFMTQLGEMTRKLHGIKRASFGVPSHGPSFSSWSELVAHDCSGFLSDTRHASIPAKDVTSLIELVERHRDELDAVEPVLIHSDLSLEHVFVSRERDGYLISGLIDLEFARFADPLSDGLLHDTLASPNAPYASAFLKGYGDIETSGVRMEIARCLARFWDVTDQARLRISVMDVPESDPV